MDTTLHDGLSGRVLDGRYRIEGRIAVGGMATVHRAVDTRLDRVLALKVMHPSLAADAEFVERFIREAKSAARLAHPNVVGVYDQGRDGELVYLAMEYVPGCTLRDVLRDRGALHPRAALDILEPVLAALGAAHRAGLVHRDVKPENVLIGDDGSVKVADFGLVRAVDSQTSTSTDSVLGTVSYLAPEQIEHGTADPRTDVYACGVLLHEMLTGAKPHSGSTPAQVLYKHLHEDVPAPSTAVPGLAAELDGLVAAATDRKPGRRPADAVALFSRTRAVRAALTAAQLDAVPPAAHEVPGARANTEARTTVLSRSSAAPERTSRLPGPPADGEGGGRRRPPRRAVVTAVAAAVLLLFGAGFWYVNSGQFTRTPAVLDQPRATAVKNVEKAGLQVRLEKEHSDHVAAGRVVSSDPEPGDRIRNTGTVTLVVSRGPDVVAVPDLSGVPLKDARHKLRSAGLTPGDVSRKFDPETSQGAVISTDPRAGTDRRPESPVALTVSRGARLDVPDVAGLAPAKARTALEEAGFRVRPAKGRVFSEEDRGTVARQSPTAGKGAARNDTVTLTLSKGPDMVEVPDVEGRDRGEARSLLRKAGFEIRERKLFFGEKVFSQSPDAGEKAPRGAEITLWLR